MIHWELLKTLKEAIGPTFYPILICAIVLFCVSFRLLLFRHVLKRVQNSQGGAMKSGWLAALWLELEPKKGFAPHRLFCERLAASLPVFDLKVLDWVGNTATSLGLLGTLLGISGVFSELRMGEVSRIPLIVKQFGPALYSTVAGLCVDIAARLGYLMGERWIAGAQTWMEESDEDLEEFSPLDGRSGAASGRVRDARDAPGARYPTVVHPSSPDTGEGGL